MTLARNRRPVAGGVFCRAWRFLVDQVVRDVPEEMALCEFDCRKPECNFSEWAACERRLARGAGEITPAVNR